MPSFYISPESEGGRGGGGPDVDDRFPERTLRSHGFIAVAFGLALGLTAMICFALLRFMKGLPSGLKAWVTEVHPNLWFTFLVGFIGGILISAIYNFLLYKRINLFGLDRNLD